MQSTLEFNFLVHRDSWCRCYRMGSEDSRTWSLLCLQGAQTCCNPVFLRVLLQLAHSCCTPQCFFGCVLRFGLSTHRVQTAFVSSSVRRLDPQPKSPSTGSETTGLHHRRRGALPTSMGSDTPLASQPRLGRTCHRTISCQTS